MSLQVLTNENRVAFFDEFVKKKINGWRLDTVTKIEVKKFEGTDEEDDASIKNLQGITSAILNGTSI